MTKTLWRAFNHCPASVVSLASTSKQAKVCQLYEVERSFVFCTSSVRRCSLLSLADDVLNAPYWLDMNVRGGSRLGSALRWQGRATRFFSVFLPVKTDDTKSHHSCRTERADVSVKHDQTSVEQMIEREREEETEREKETPSEPSAAVQLTMV